MRSALAAKTILDDPELVAEFERLLDAEKSWQSREEHLLDQLKDLEERLLATRRNFYEYAAASDSLPNEEVVDDIPPTLRTVVDAVSAAAKECPHLVFLPEAFSSAQQSEYENPDQVYHDLVALDNVAARWDNDDLPQGWDRAFVEVGIGGAYRSGISFTAGSQFRSDYMRSYRGSPILLESHIRRGTGSPARILRIYWYRDDDYQGERRVDRTGRAIRKVFVVGHVGRKLRDVSNQ
jgi:hypothetical protein